MKKFLLLLLTGSLCVAVKSQTYTQPTVGLQSTNEGACMVNTASGVSYDNGGSGGNYSANINNIYRTFCPSVPGMMVRLTFTSFSMNDTYFLCYGPNSCCDYLIIYDGPNTNCPILYSNCTTSPGTITATNPTGCLTLVQTTDGSVQLSGWAANISNVAASGGPSGTLNNDCSRATPVCNGPIVFAGSSEGPGLVSETCSDCALSEQYSMWYKIGIATSGTLAFTLDPNNNGNDYDFALYGPNVTCGTLGTPIRCTKAGGAGNGNTGMGNGAVDLSETIVGDQWVSELSVTAGETYYLMINQKDDSYSGFNLNWTGTAVLSSITVASTSQTNVTCFGGSNGTASIATPTGGTAPYSYDWAPGTPTGDGTTSVSGLIAGSWTCTVTDAAGCSNVQVFSIAQPPTPVTVTSLSQTNVSCFGGTNGAAAINTPTGGAGGYVFDWTPGNPTGDGTTAVSGLSAQTYSCTVTDVSGCTATQTFNITSPSAIAVTASSQSNISCNGGSNGTASINTPTGGAGGYTYDWTPGNPTGDGTVSATGLTAGTWTCTVTDANSCTTTQTFNITAPSALAATSSAGSILCNGGTTTVTVVGTGGTSPYTGAGTFTVTAGAYSYVVTDANACTNTTSITITEPTALTAAATAPAISCNGGSATVTVVGAGGTAPYTGEGSFTVNAGTHSYTVTDANGCTVTTPITITEPTALTATASATAIPCAGGTTNITVVGSGGTAPYAGEGTFTVAAGTYSYTVTDTNACAVTTSITVTEPAVLSIMINSFSNPTLCGGTDGTIDIGISGGTPGYSYLWNNSATTQDVFGLSAGVYTCVILDSNSCGTQVIVTLSDPNAPTVTLTLPSDTVCVADGAFVLGGESPIGGTFSGPGVTASSFDPTAAGVGMHMISYTFVDGNGCSGSTTDSIYVDVCTSSDIWNLRSEVSIYPNPNNGTFVVNLNSTSTASVEIHSAVGQLVSAQQIQPNRDEQITIETLGVYFITVIESDGKRSTQRVVVNK